MGTQCSIGSQGNATALRDVIRDSEQVWEVGLPPCVGLGRLLLNFGSGLGIGAAGRRLEKGKD